MNSLYRDYLSSPEWAEKRRQVFERALRNSGSKNLHGICERCHYEPWRPVLQVHHLSYKNFGCEPLEDLILLCPNCHRKAHEIEKNSERKEKNMENTAKNGFTYEVIKKIGALSPNKQLNFISWNGMKPVYDLRNWGTKDGTTKALKGITLTHDDIIQLRDLLNRMDL